MTAAEKGPAAAKVQRHARRKMGTRIPVPFTGRHIDLPAGPDSLAFDAAIAALAVAEMIDWPVGLMLIAGHWLSGRRSSSRVESAIGEAFEEAA